MTAPAPPTKQQILDGDAIAPWPDSPQERALQSDADIVIYGGAAGGAKTYALLLAALRGHGDDAFRGAIFRRTYPQLSAPGAVIDESRGLYPATRASYTEGKHEWRWPSGAWLKFSHLQHEKNLEDWDGAQIAFAGFDQLEQFDQRALFYLQGRCRAPDYGGKCQVFATCNPTGESHWLFELIRWWLQPAEDGMGYVPDPDKAGRKRYLFRRGDEIRWVGKDARDEDGEPPISITYIPAKVEDNPAIMEKDRSYLQRLNTLGFVDRLQKKSGRWGVSQVDGPFKRHCIQVVPRSKVPPGKSVRYWDLADTEPHPDNPEPCHTAGVRTLTIRRQWSLCGFGEETGEEDCGFWQPGILASKDCPECGKRSIQTGKMPVCIVEDADWFLLSGSKKKNRMRSVATRDGRGVVIALELEPGATGKESGRDYRVNTFERGYTVELDRPTGSKMTRVGDLVPLSETGRLWLVDGPWNADFITALESMDPMDVIDGLTGSYKVSSRYAGSGLGSSLSRSRKVGGSSNPFS